MKIYLSSLVLLVILLSLCAQKCVGEGRPIIVVNLYVDRQEVQGLQCMDVDYLGNCRKKACYCITIAEYCLSHVYYLHDRYLLLHL